MRLWFIFTADHRVCTAQASSLKGAHAAYRKQRPRDASEVVGIIMGAAEVEGLGQLVGTPVAGVIICGFNNVNQLPSATAK
jgi:hypothetical protein